MKIENYKIIFGYIIICLIWGSTWLFIRFGLDSLTPIVSAGFRFSLAAIMIFVLMKFKKIEMLIDSNSLKIYVILGLFSFLVPFALVYWAEQFIPSGLTSVLFSVMPFFVILFSFFAIKGEVISIFQIIGVGFGFGGIVTIFSENLNIDLSNNIFGMVAVLLSSIIQAGIGVYIKKFGKHLNPLTMNFFPLLIAGVLMIFLGFIFEDTTRLKFDSKAVISVVYLAFVGTVVAFSTYYWLMKRINLIFLSLSSFITPIIAVFLGWLFLGENFSKQALIGSLLVLVGILFANFAEVKNYFKTKFRFE